MEASVAYQYLRPKQMVERRDAMPVAYMGWAFLNGMDCIILWDLMVLTYALNQKEPLNNFLLDGRIELSNNRAENAIRPYVTGRTGFLPIQPAVPKPVPLSIE